MDKDKGLKPVKDFFEKESVQPKEQAEEQKKEDIVIKGHTVDEKTKKEIPEDEEISFDFSKVRRWLKKGTSIDNRKHKQQKETKKKASKGFKMPSLSFLKSKEAKDNAKKFVAF